ncbi:winged helix-turn-helix domain-containing protein [Sphingomonas sp.]|uniref:protein kinase domain-containing protein n=1 Tax=Sphingomonas sp. TaxID=28214 RepID=UPI001B17D7F2|nr:winged helix-turn-helix domain-containing protein [Sphingomonas sp.]MBO9713279.1 winged helix-turn-helix domain-containing protein [Sphingomonas sp.]
MSATTAGSRRRRRRWRFATAAFDEGSWALEVGGTAVSIETKPLELLHELLLRAGEVVTKSELLDAVWPGIVVVEASLPTAISKLRRALGDGDGKIVETVPRIGYRLAAPVSVETLAGPLMPRFSFQAGEEVPGRPQWRLLESLGDTGADDVWRAVHEKTGARRIFKFADAPDRLRGLKREAAIARLLMASLAEDGPYVPLLEWNFATSPYWLESVDGGASLVDWAAAKGGLAAIPLAQRLEVARLVARALETVHGVGVLHKDLKPANILIEERDGAPRIRLADFGSGVVMDDDLLAAHAITPFLDGEKDQGSRSGTLLYRAPELVGDAVPTARSDIFALGLILYQLAAGDFGRNLAPGWEAAIGDPLLEADIAEAAAGDPEQRLGAASLLADRLDRLEQRRAALLEATERDAQLAALKREEERRAQRRPWVRAAAAAAIVGLVGTSGFALVANRQRQEAQRQGRIAEASYGFLADDLLGRTDPTRSQSAAETLADAAKRAGAEIDRRFAADPLVAARLHATLARAFQERSDFPAMRSEFDAAERNFRRAGAQNGEDATVARLTRAQAEAMSGQKDGLDAAQAIIAAERKRLGPAADTGPIGFALARAEGIAGFFGDLKVADAAFTRAIGYAKAHPDAVSQRDSLRLRSTHALVLMRLGQGEQAEREMRPVVAEATAAFGPDHPDTLNARQVLLNALMLQHRDAEVIKGVTELLPLFDKRYGPDHRLTLALHSTRGDMLAELGRYREAAEDSRRVWQGASKTSGAESHQALVGHIDLGMDECRGGELAAGLADVRAGLRDTEAAFGSDYPLTHAARYYAAECLVENQRFDEAAALAATVDPALVGQLVGDPEWHAELDAVKAEIALAHGDKAAARKLYAALAPNTAGLDAASYERRRLARIAAALGR